MIRAASPLDVTIAVVRGGERRVTVHTLVRPLGRLIVARVTSQVLVELCRSDEGLVAVRARVGPFPGVEVVVVGQCLLVGELLLANVALELLDPVVPGLVDVEVGLFPEPLVAEPAFVGSLSAVDHQMAGQMTVL